MCPRNFTLELKDTTLDLGKQQLCCLDYLTVKVAQMCAHVDDGVYFHYNRTEPLE